MACGKPVVASSSSCRGDRRRRRAGRSVRRRVIGAVSRRVRGSGARAEMSRRAGWRGQSRGNNRWPRRARSRGLGAGASAGSRASTTCGPAARAREVLEALCEQFPPPTSSRCSPACRFAAIERTASRRRSSVVPLADSRPALPSAVSRRRRAVRSRRTAVTARARVARARSPRAAPAPLLLNPPPPPPPLLAHALRLGPVRRLLRTRTSQPPPAPGTGSKAR